VAMLAGVFVAAIHHLRYGRKHPDAQRHDPEEHA
jgi:hypothetical protein